MYFDNCKTVEEAKREYRRLAMQMHPDKGGKKEDFQTLNDEYRQFLIGRQGKQAGESTFQESVTDLISWLKKHAPDMLVFFKENFPDEYEKILESVMNNPIGKIAIGIIGALKK